MKSRKTYCVKEAIRSALLSCFLLLIPGVYKTVAQTAPEHQIKAVFLFNFTRFVNWPEKAFESAASPFVIGILGKDPFGADLEQAIRDEKVGDHPIIIKHYSDVKDVDNCHILYVNDLEPVRPVLGELNRRGILTVGDAPNFVAAGGIIGFFLEKNKVRMEISPEAAKAGSLEISSRLLRVSKVSNN